MAAINFKVESGVQLLARLLKRPDNIEQLYPPLFQSGPKCGETIELFSEVSLAPLLMDIICEALIPTDFGGPQLSIVLFSTDGNMDYNQLICCLRKKLLCKSKTLQAVDNMEKVVKNALKNLIILKIYDATQFYTTIHNTESIMMEYHISLIVFDTLTAFYWSEHGYKITKMDLYIKNLLQLIRKITKDYKVTLLYTRPEYFSSSKDTIEHLEACSEFPLIDKVNYRIQLLPYNNDYKTYQVIVKKFDTQFIRSFTMIDNQINWILE